jgi:RNA polymerase-binding transcription factor DksA
MLDPAFIQQMKNRLLGEKADVEAKLVELNAPEKGMDNPDENDLANDASEDIIEDSIRVTYQDLLTRIEAALRRVEAGSYGICTRDGKEILREKLEQEPWAERCCGTEA